MRVRTVSGSVYEFDTKEMLMRRINQVGQPLIIFMEPLKPKWADTNVRMTTTISDIEEVK